MRSLLLLAVLALSCGAPPSNPPLPDAGQQSPSDAGTAPAFSCEPDRFFCERDRAYLCNRSGADATLYQNCTLSGKRCMLVGDGAVCQ